MAERARGKEFAVVIPHQGAMNLPVRSLELTAEASAIASGAAHAAEPGSAALVRQALRLGLFLASSLQPRWLVHVFSDAAARRIAEVVVIAEAASAPSSLPWAWRLFDRLDTALFCPGPDLLTWVALKQHVPHAQCMAYPHAAQAPGNLSSWRAGLLDLRLDIAVVLGDVDVRWLEGLARYGVWRYAFGASRHAHDRLVGWHEVLKAIPVTEAALIVRRRSGEERIAYQSWSRTFPFSTARNRQQVLRKLMSCTVRAMEQVRNEGDAWLDRCPACQDTSAPPHIVPGASQVLRAAGTVGRRIAQRAVEKLTSVDQWFIAYRFGSDESWQGSLQGFRRLLPPKDRIWADPFPIEHDGRYYIFFEELTFDRGKGHISVIEVARNGECSPARKVLERDYHLSYPCLLEHDGELFMVPESLQNRTVDLYRCVRFPDRWELEQTLLRDARGADATLYQQDGYWWMFVTVGIAGAEAYDELHLFRAERLQGPWHPHRVNPVKSDVRGARSAGHLFSRGGRLYRPAQICAPLYGSGLAIHEVLELSPHSYLEREERRILPAPGERLLGLHTWNRANDLCVIDAFTRRPRFGAD